MTKTVIILPLLFLLGGLVFVFLSAPTPPKGGVNPVATVTPAQRVSPEAAPSPAPAAPSTPSAEKKGTPTVALKTTAGEMTFELSSQTPKTTANFINLAEKGFYNQTIFHRVIKGFMIQGGDPRGDGSGGPGYTFADEPFTGDYVRGTLAMANAGPNTNGSQFFVVHRDTNLPKNYVIFGKLTAGFDVLDAIATGEVGPSSSGELSRPLKPVKILEAEVRP